MAKRSKKVNRRAKGEGTIYWYEPRQCYAAQLTVGTNPATGKPKKTTVYGKTQSVVLEKLQKLEMQRNLGARLDQNTVTISEWLDRWLANYMQKKLRATTFASYKKEMRLHVRPYIGNITLKSLQPDDLQTLFNNLLDNGRIKAQKDKDATDQDKQQKEIPPGLSRRTVQYIRAILRECLAQAVLNRVIIFNPVDATTLPPLVKKEAEAFTKEEAEKFLNTAKSSRMFAGYYLGMFTGMRRGEMLGLMWDDFDWAAPSFEIERELVEIRDDDTGKVHLDFGLPKTPKSQRTIPMTEDMVKVLKAHKSRQNAERLFFGAAYHNENLVFCTEAGKRIWPRNFNRQYAALLKKAGVEYKKPHSMRHTFASRLIEDGEDLRNVQELLGHTMLSTTADIYSHVTERTKKKVMSRMSGLLNVEVD
jgi:integrase